MALDWLIVGEVRTGQAALSLFRAQMSDHPRLCTFHAEGQEAAVHRMSLIMFADAQVRMEAAKEIFVQAVDLVVQVGWLEGKRKILGVWETAPEMKAGNVVFRQVYMPGEMELYRINRRGVMGKMKGSLHGGHSLCQAVSLDRLIQADKASLHLLKQAL